jgi:diguanylate cyclase (GGDEF)-like protein
MDNIFLTIDYTRYRELVGSLRVGVKAIAVFDVDAQQVWADGEIERIPRRWAHLRATQEGNGLVRFFMLDQDIGLYWHPLHAFSSDVVGTLLLVVQSIDQCTQAANGSDAHEQLCSVLKNVAACIQVEYQLLFELEQMGTELTDRWNELTMVYDTEDQGQKFEDSEELLNALVNNCNQYLDVELAALLLPKKNIFFVVPQDGLTVSHFNKPLGFVETELLNWLLLNKTSIVLNCVKDYRGLVTDVVDHWKMIASPIVDAKRQIDGALFAINSRDKTDFTNSDRNLLEAMSSKVSKIIQSNFDAVTGLINRAGFESLLETALNSVRGSLIVHSVLIVDLDQLQIVNDVAGHSEGDELIRRVGQLLFDLVGNSDKVARLGGDVFGVLYFSCDTAKASEKARQLRQEIAKINFVAGLSRFDVTASIGIAPISQKEHSVASILSCAELACEAAKDAGRNAERVFALEDNEMVLRKEQYRWANRTQSALREDRFELYVQPIQPLFSSHGYRHYEVLLRMRVERGRVLAPGYFMPAAERFAMMPMLDRWVIDRTLKIVSEHLDLFRSSAGHLAINLSGQSIGQEGFLPYIVDRIQQSRVPPEMLCFEITETVAIKSMDRALNLINIVKALGCRFSLDDFGTGMSTFTYLRTLPINYLKIDGSFIRDIVTDPIAQTMVLAIQQVARVMGLETIAEFVENKKIQTKLQQIGIDYAQGYGIGKPRPLLNEIETLSKKLDETVL